MRIQGIRRLFPYLFMLGIFSGIFYVNIFARDHVLARGIFSDSFLESYNEPGNMGADYFFYLMYIRLLPIVVILLLAVTKAKRASVLAMIFGTGFITGFSFTGAILKMGIKGLVLCLVSLMPHFPCYTAAYLLVLWQLYYGAGRLWNGVRVCCFTVLTTVGLITEYYINPVLVSMFVRTLS